MKKSIYLFLSAIILMSFSVPSDNWVTFKSKKANYKIDFPKKPEIKEKQGKRSLTVKAKSIDEHYRYSLIATVAKNEYKGTKELTGKLYEIFIEKLGGKVEEKSTFKVDSFEGISAKIKSDKGASTFYRIIIIKNIIYQFTIISGTDYAPQEIQTKFFGSFNLLKK